MTFETESSKLGRIPLEFVELEMDYCANAYGSSPCTASVGVTGTQKCFNTYGTCQDKANYTASTKTYRFCQPNSLLPVGVQAFPLLKKLSMAPQTLTPGKGLGVRAAVTVRFADMPHTDAGVDPYVSTRSYVPEEQGTFWGKFRARNEFYEGRQIKIRTGYLGDSFSWSNFQDRVYVIESFKGPSRAGEYDIVAKDVLKLADDNRALCPSPSNGRLSAGISSSATSFTLTPAGIGDQEYATAGRVVINGEGIDFTRTAGSDTCTVTARDVYGVGAKAHNIDSTVQLVKRYQTEEIQNVIYDLFTNYVPGFNSSWITLADWDLERDTFLPGTWSTDICEPTGVNTLLAELMEQGTCYIFWDEAAQQIRFRALRPPAAGIPVLQEGRDFNEGSLQCSDDAGQRISRVYVLYDRKDPTRKLDEQSNYRQRYVGADLESEGDNEYRSKRIKTVYSRWFTSLSAGRVEILAETLAKRYSKPPRMMDYEADISQINTVGLADRFVANTRQFQDVTGSNADVNMQVIEHQQSAGKAGSTIRVKAQEYVWNERVNNTSSLRIIISTPQTNLNLYDAFVAEYGSPITGQSVEFLMLTSVDHGSASASLPAVRTGSAWPSGVALSMVNRSKLRGAGGNGGNYLSTTGNGNGGGTAFKAEYPITVDNGAGEILGGGGGGGGVYPTDPGVPKSYGGGGAGLAGGHGQYGNGVGGGPFNHDGTMSAGGTGWTKNGDSTGGNGGGPGLPGSAATYSGGGSFAAGTGGAAGNAVEGNSFITWTATGTRTGPIT